MQHDAERRRSGLRPARFRSPGRLRKRDRSHPWDNRPATGTYRDNVAASPISADVSRARFAAFVQRALERARAGGLTDREIARRSGVATSTFHRWRLGEGNTLPKIDKVRSFCEVTGVSLDEAMRALGMTDNARSEPTPAAPLPEDVRIILRTLADPNVDEAQKAAIRGILQLLATRAEGGGKARLLPALDLLDDGRDEATS